MKKRKYIIEFIQKQKTAFIGSVDEEGFPNMKAMFTPRKIDGNCFFFFDQYIFHAFAAVYEESKGKYLFL